MREGKGASPVADRSLEAAVAAPGEPVGHVQSIGEAIAGVRSVAASRQLTLAKPLPEPPRNPWGGSLLAPRHGATGMAGLRADLLDGSVTEQELTAMSQRQLAERYGVARSVAYRMRRHVLAYGLGGATRLPNGSRRASPLPPLP